MLVVVVGHSSRGRGCSSSSGSCSGGSSRCPGPDQLKNLSITKLSSRYKINGNTDDVIVFYRSGYLFFQWSKPSCVPKH